MKTNNPAIYGIFPEDYSVIRELLRICFLYGCFTGADIARGTYFLPQRSQGDSIIRKSTYSTRLKQLQKLFPETFLQKSEGKTKIYSISSDLYDGMDDMLLRSYKARTFTTGQFMNYFLILLAAEKITEESEDDSTAFSVNAIASAITDACDAAAGAIPEPVTRECQVLMDDRPGKAFDALKTHVNALLEDGVLSPANKNAVLSVYDAPVFDDEARFQNNKLFSLAPDILGDMKPATLQHLYSLLDHCSKSETLRLPFYLAKCRIKLYCKAHGVVLDEPQAIKYRHNYLFGILDEEIVISLLHAIYCRESVVISHKYDEFTYGKDDTFHKIDELRVIPAYIRYDTDSGRSYLACYDVQEKKAMMIRLDLILDVHSPEKPDSKMIAAAFSECSQLMNAWCASPVNYESRHRLHLRFRAPQRKAYLADDVKRHFQPSQIKEIKTGDDSIELLITAEISDPVEMLPWIRSMGQYIEVLQDTDDGKKLSALVRKSFEQMLRNYTVSGGKQ